MTSKSGAGANPAVKEEYPAGGWGPVEAEVADKAAVVAIRRTSEKAASHNLIA